MPIVPGQLHGRARGMTSSLIFSCAIVRNVYTLTYSEKFGQLKFDGMIVGAATPSMRCRGGNVITGRRRSSYPVSYLVFAGSGAAIAYIFPFVEFH